MNLSPKAGWRPAEAITGDSTMLRLLTIGREAASWGNKLQQKGGDQLDVDTARLPAAGLRQFEATPPDAVIIIDTSSAKRAATLVDALRERPLGQLIPVVVVAPPAGDEQSDAVDAWLSPDADDAQVAAAVEEHLGVSLTGHDESAPEPARSRQQTPHGGEADASAAQDSEPAYFIEEIDEAEERAERRPKKLHRDAIFSSSSERGRSGGEGRALDEEAIRRKLKTVRHEDYYAILEVRRGAEGAVVREAFHRLARRYDDERLDFELAHRFEDELDEIRDALEDAWAVLGDSKLREAYLEHTTRR